LNEDTVAVLEAEKRKHPRMCFTYRGEPMWWGICNTGWLAAARKAELADFRFHDLRHAWASWHHQAGTSCDELKDLGGRWSTATRSSRRSICPPRLRALKHAGQVTT